MDDTQESVVNIKSEINLNEDIGLNPTQLLLNHFHEYEREIQILERDIRQQKESSVNAKTAITFDQLKKIHNLGKVLGPQKEAFFDRVCRAADIQRASLKNRLKQNKEKFEPPTPTTLMVRSPTFHDSPSQDVQAYLAPPTLHSIALLPSTNELIRSSSLSTIEMPPTTPGSIIEEDMKIPGERSLDLMQLGFSFDEVKQINDLFEQYKELMKPHNPTLTLQQVLSQFSNFISITVPDHLKLISSSFNLLEMGYSRAEVARTLIKERRKISMELDDAEIKPFKRPCLSPQTNEMTSSPGGEEETGDGELSHQDE